MSTKMMCTPYCVSWFVATSTALLLLASPSLAASGSATYYTAPYTPSACYGNDPNQFPAGNLFAAASPAIYNNGAACGTYYQIACTGNGCNGGGPITVKIVDLCPGCASNQFDLSAEAFADIANQSAGRISITYQQA